LLFYNKFQQLQTKNQNQRAKVTFDYQEVSREYQDVSFLDIGEYQDVSGRIKTYHFLSFFLSCFRNFPFFVQKPPQNPLYFSKYQVFSSHRSLFFLCFRLISVLIIPSVCAWNKCILFHIQEAGVDSVRVRVEQMGRACFRRKSAESKLFNRSLAHVLTVPFACLYQQAN
jgi:hypothetical protein